MTPSPSVESLREKVARIIRPQAWEKNASGLWRFRDALKCQAEALTKADSILALLPSPEWKSMESASSSNASRAATRDHSLAATEAERSAAWVVVPPDATPAMIAAASGQPYNNDDFLMNFDVSLAYRAMIAASPIPSLGGGNSMTSRADLSAHAASAAATDTEEGH